MPWFILVMAAGVVTAALAGIVWLMWYLKDFWNP